MSNGEMRTLEKTSSASCGTKANKNKAHEKVCVH